MPLALTGNLATPPVSNKVVFPLVGFPTYAVERARQVRRRIVDCPHVSLERSFIVLQGDLAALEPAIDTLMSCDMRTNKSVF